LKKQARDEPVLKKAELKDTVYFYTLRNDPDVNKFFFNKAPIEFADHEKWFRDKICSEDSLVFVAYVDDETRIGTLRFDRENESAFCVSIAIARQYWGRGYGTKMIQAGHKILAQQTRGYFMVWADIKSSNEGSVRLFKKVGYIKIQENNNMGRFEFHYGGV
jgi:RimJ/RimL family protein N-acetyltransferase